jgi:hypothetical protein
MADGYDREAHRADLRALLGVTTMLHSVVQAHDDFIACGTQENAEKMRLAMDVARRHLKTELDAGIRRLLQREN